MVASVSHYFRVDHSIRRYTNEGDLTTRSLELLQ